MSKFFSIYKEKVEKERVLHSMYYSSKQMLLEISGETGPGYRRVGDPEKIDSIQTRGAGPDLKLEDYDAVDGSNLPGVTNWNPDV